MPKRPPKETIGSIFAGDGPFLFAAFAVSLFASALFIHLLIQAF